MTAERWRDGGAGAGAPAPILVLAGPTATGKTAVALELAEGMARTGRSGEPAPGAEILSADARQIYRGMRIGSAQPTAGERARVGHHLVDCIDPLLLYTAADFARDGHQVLDDLARRGVPPLVVGGSGLYIRALVEGLFAGPGRDPALRAALVARAERAGDEALHAELERLDAETAARLHPRDRVRVVRALEVALLTGKPLSAHHREHAEKQRSQPAGSLRARSRFVILDRRRDDLKRRIAARTAAMFAGGLVDEARALVARGLGAEHPASRTLGYAETFAMLRGEIDLEAARAATVAATWRYARRQRTWFRAVADAVWVTAEPDEEPAQTAARVLAALGASSERSTRGAQGPGRRTQSP